MKNSLALGLALALAMSLPMSAEAKSNGNGGNDKKAILSCAAASSTIDISMSSRYVTRVKNGKTKRQFKAEFEAAPRLGYTRGQVMTVLVNNVKVGTRKLKRVFNGDLKAELEFETGSAGNGRFPANFPTVAANTTVAVQFNGATVLSCALK